MDKDFSLIPFTSPVSGIEGISGTIGLQKDNLVINYQVTGDIESLSMPQPQAAPVRRDGLWKENCFECFVQGVGREDYHEMNLSPSGDWNVYHFTKYRTGMVAESAVDNIDSMVCIELDRATIRCQIPLIGCHAGISSVSIGISCILLHNSGKVSYWALTHPGAKPDFHDSRAFCLKLWC